MKQKAGKGSSGGKIRLRSQLVANYPWWPPAPPPFIDFFEKWRIVDLCCVSFRSLAKGFSDTFFIRLFPHISYYKILSRVHCAVCRPLLVIYLICNSVYINPKLLIYPFPPHLSSNGPEVLWSWTLVGSPFPPLLVAIDLVLCPRLTEQGDWSWPPCTQGSEVGRERRRRMFCSRKWVAVSRSI